MSEAAASQEEQQPAGADQAFAALGGREADIHLEKVTKRFGEMTAVDELTLSIERGAFYAMLGPSGCGKTTTLRMIGGFEDPTDGKVYLGGDEITDQPPYKRDVNTVFQSYALFPHLSVERNVGFGLERKKVSKSEVKQRVGEALELVQLGGLGKRKPGQLSGGQQQRVALARALVNRPRVLLLDEPLGALDLKLREEMQIELKAIQQEVGITFIYVTHDQEEALTMSDRIAVFNRGRIEQMGTPADLYERPSTAFVAGFVGTSNLLRDDVAKTLVGMDGLFTVRPEKIRMGEPGASVADDEVGADGTIRAVVYLGPDTRYIVALDAGSELVVTQQNLDRTSMEVLAAQGQPVRLVWKRQHVLRVQE